MKYAILAIVLAAATSAHAGLNSNFGASSSLITIGKSSAPPLTFEAANRKGSKRVGGSGRSGKGGRYVGGLK